MTRPAPNAHLIGEEGSRSRLLTPALVLDLDALEHNIAAMAAHFAALDTGFRPHAKTHKCVAVAKLQMAAGAAGICAAKLGEAEALVEGGVGRILVTSPIVTEAKLARALALGDEAEDLLLVVDDVAAVDLLASLAAARARPVGVLVDLGIESNRTGVPTIAGAVGLAREILARPALALRGLQCYAGEVQHVEDCADREREARRIARVIGETRRAIEEVAGPLDIVTGGGTGTFDHDSRCGVFSDIQVGSFIFMDAQYNAVKRRDGTAGPFRTSLFVQSTVISAGLASAVTTDAGIKAFATDGPPPVIADGAPDGSLYEFMGDEHGRIILPSGANGPGIGSVVTCVTPHCDPTVNLHDHYHCVRRDRLVDIWPVDARGRGW